MVPGGFGAVFFEFLRLVAFAARDPDFFLGGLLVMAFPRILRRRSAPLPGQARAGRAWSH